MCRYVTKHDPVHFFRHPSNAEGTRKQHKDNRKLYEPLLPRSDSCARRGAKFLSTLNAFLILAQFTLAPTSSSSPSDTSFCSGFSALSEHPLPPSFLLVELAVAIPSCRPRASPPQPSLPRASWHDEPGPRPAACGGLHEENGEAGG